MDDELIFGAFGWEWNKSNFAMEILESGRYDDCLKPCPFCGHTEPRVIHDGNHYHVYCPHCLVKVCAESTAEKAIDRWNQRLDTVATTRTDYEDEEEDEQEELKPCPLCGEQVEIKEDLLCGCDVSYYIQCNNCKANVGGIDRDELVEIWNDRDVDRSKALKPCPLCGGPAEFWQDDDGWSVRCSAEADGCGFSTPDFATKEEAMKLWNGGLDE